MPAFALLLCSAAAVLGTLAAVPLPSDLRLICDCAVVAGAACGAFGKWPLRLLGLLAGLFALAAVNAALREHSQITVVERRTARYGATLLEASSAADGSTALTLALDNRLHVLARVNDAPPPGSRVVIRGRLEPFDQPRNPDEPSERAIESERGFDARLDGAQILSSSPGTSLDPHAWLARAHAWAHAQLRDRLGEPAASVVAGELWGERSALPPDLRSQFQETGTVHVLVTAGLHLGAVAALCTALLAPLALPRWIGCAATIVLVWSFVWWSGAQLPAVRAATMVTAVLAARACGRATFSWNSLAIAALVLTYARPQSIATASFALSFSCVGAIFAWAGPLEQWIEARIALPDRVREALVLSLA
ncbi:MAG TPA: ComEC/Rec2 family competence protein, partial [Candidatus Cybelea sp.]